MSNEQSSGYRIEQNLSALAHKADRVIMWDISEEQHTEAVIEGLCQCSFIAYRRRLTDASAEFRRQGIRVDLVPASIERMLDTLWLNNLPLDPGGIAAAVGLLAPPFDETGMSEPSLIGYWTEPDCLPTNTFQD